MGIKNSKNRLTKKQTKIHNTISINFKFIQPYIYTVVVAIHKENIPFHAVQFYTSGSFLSKKDCWERLR